MVVVIPTLVPLRTFFGEARPL